MSLYLSSSKDSVYAFDFLINLLCKSLHINYILYSKPINNNNNNKNLYQIQKHIINPDYPNATLFYTGNHYDVIYKACDWDKLPLESIEYRLT
jgi:hypothetical protein